MTFRILAILATLAGLHVPAAANPLKESLAADGNSCWERTYNGTHLKAHPKQRVVKIRLATEVQDDGTIYAQLGMNLRERTYSGKFDYAAVAFCKARGEGLRCTPEWDAGHFTIERTGKSALLVRNSRMIINPSNYDSEDIAPGAVDLGNSDDRSWRLNRKSDEGCNIY